MATSQRTLQMSFAKGILLQFVDTELLTQSLGVLGQLAFLQCCFYFSIMMAKFSRSCHYSFLCSSS